MFDNGKADNRFKQDVDSASRVSLPTHLEDSTFGPTGPQ